METDTGEEMTGDRQQKRKTGSQEAKSWALGSQGLRAPEPATRWQNEPSFGTRQIWVQILTRYEALGRTRFLGVSCLTCNRESYCWMGKDKLWKMPDS